MTIEHGFETRMPLGSTRASTQLRDQAQDECLELLKDAGHDFGWQEGGSRIFAEALHAWSSGKVATAIVVDRSERAPIPPQAIGLLPLTGEGADRHLVVTPDGVDTLSEYQLKHPGAELLAGASADRVLEEFPTCDDAQLWIEMQLGGTLGAYAQWENRLQQELAVAGLGIRIAMTEVGTLSQPCGHGADPVAQLDTLKAFMRALEAGGDWDASKAKWDFTYPTSPRVSKIRSHDAVSVELSIASSEGLVLNSIEVDPHLRGYGYGSTVLTEFLQVADKHDLQVELFARPYGQSPMDRETLSGWYERHGFMETPRGHLRPSLSERAPQIAKHKGVAENDVDLPAINPNWASL